uniref:Carboxylesterase n=1 Tax=Oxya chinensis TaxID=165482 RepID=A0A0C5KCB5_9ORTH|nr:carboxylesterase [Oxya chinensis]
MEMRTWLFVALLVAACIPLTLADDPSETTTTAVPSVETDNNTGTGSTETTKPEGKNDTGAGSTETAKPGGKNEDQQTTNTENSTETGSTTETIETVTKKDFDITGVRMKSITGRYFNAFCGIPYAEPPLGLRRFKHPVRMTYDGNIDATKCEETPICMQMFWQKDTVKAIGSEDCLFLNVYEPEAEITNLPVLVYFHGGGFYSGSGTFNDAGPHYLMDQDVIFVTVNYRLGPLGFFGLNERDSPGNMGMSDQVMALQWVKDNIKHFHGDRFRVTIMGEGAGGASVHLHLFSQMSKGLFSRAISLTGVAFNSWALMDDMVNKSRTHAAFLACNKPKSSDTMKCMREVPAEKIVESTKGLNFWLHEPPVIYKPAVQEGQGGKDVFLLRDPLDLLADRKFHNVPWLVGIVNMPGFFHTKRYLKDNIMLTALLGKFDEYGPSMLTMPLSIPDANLREQAMKQIKEIYKTKHGSFNRDSLIQIFNDREHYLGHMLAVVYHSLLFHDNIYQFRFDYRGKHSMAENYTAVKKTEVVNEDELIYLLRRPKLFPDFDRSDEEGKRDFHMMKRFTSIIAEFAATGNVKGLHRSKRDNAAVTQMSADTNGKGILAYLFNKLLSRQKRSPQMEISPANDNSDEPLIASLRDSEDELPITGVVRDFWDKFVDRKWEKKSTCWKNHFSTVWPAVKRFPFTAGNVPLLPYMSFRKGENDVAVEYCLRYLMELGSLIHWTRLPLKEVVAPEIFLSVTTTTMGTPETTIATETTHHLCPTMPVNIWSTTEEPQSTQQSSQFSEPPWLPTHGPPPPPPPPPPATPTTRPSRRRTCHRNSR